MEHRISFLSRVWRADDPRAIDVRARPLAGDAPGVAAELAAAGIRLGFAAVGTEAEAEALRGLAPSARLRGLVVLDPEHPVEGATKLRRLAERYADVVAGALLRPTAAGSDLRHRDLAPLYAACAEYRLPLQIEAEADGVDGLVVAGVLAVCLRPASVVCTHPDPTRLEELAGYLARYPNLFAALDVVAAAGEEAPLAGLLRLHGSRQVLLAGRRLKDDPGDAARMTALARLPRRQRDAAGWRTAVSVYGSRLMAGGPLVV
jgi:hypothetical protein